MKQGKHMKSQRGGFAMGLIVGLLVGLAIALGVALYVTKVPVPFVNKVPQRTAEHDAAELERNKNWDPNAPLAGKNPARPQVAPPPAPAASKPAMAATGNGAASGVQAPVAGNGRDPAAILADRPSAAVSQAASTKPGPEPFTYFVQAGAYSRAEEAEQQRAKLAMLGLEAKITEREQSGRTVYRVRVGPFDKREDADSAKSRLDGSDIESALVRVQN
jgi:cell division protein FtsN